MKRILRIASGLVFIAAVGLLSACGDTAGSGTSGNKTTTPPEATRPAQPPGGPGGAPGGPGGAPGTMPLPGGR